MLLSVVFAFEHGISESNRDLKLECRNIHNFRHNQIRWAAVKKAYVRDELLVAGVMKDKHRGVYEAYPTALLFRTKTFLPL